MLIVYGVCRLSALKSAHTSSSCSASRSTSTCAVCGANYNLDWQAHERHELDEWVPRLCLISPQQPHRLHRRCNSSCHTGSQRISSVVRAPIHFSGSATATLQIYGGASRIKCNKNLSFAYLAVDDNFSFFHSLRADLEIDLLHFYSHVTCVRWRTRLL